MHNQSEECGTNKSCGSCCSCHKCCGVSWSGIIVGAIVAVGLSFLLNSFFMAIGLIAFTTSPSGMVTLAVGGYIGALIGVVAVMYFSGWIAGYIGRKHSSYRCFGALNGFLVWSLALVLTIAIAAHAVAFMDSNFRALPHHNMIPHQMVNAPVPPAATPPAVATKGAMMKGTMTKTMNQPVPKNPSENLGKSLLFIFILFLAGALASTIGGICGVGCCRKGSCDTGSCGDKPKDPNKTCC